MNGSLLPTTYTHTQGSRPTPPYKVAARRIISALQGDYTAHLYHHLKGEDTCENVVQVLQGLKAEGTDGLRGCERTERPAPWPNAPHGALTLFLGESVRTGSSAARAMLLRAMTTRMTISKYRMVTM